MVRYLGYIDISRQSVYLVYLVSICIYIYHLLKKGGMTLCPLPRPASSPAQKLKVPCEVMEWLHWDTTARSTAAVHSGFREAASEQTCWGCLTMLRWRVQ